MEGRKVRDRLGNEGRIVQQLPEQSGVIVQLWDGRSLLVPVDVLELERGGLYSVAFSFLDEEEMASANAAVVPAAFRSAVGIQPPLQPVHEEVETIAETTAPAGATVIEEEVMELPEETLMTEEVSVERVPVGREVDSVPETRIEGDTTVVPVVEEVLVVEKRLILKEEVRITKRRQTARRRPITVEEYAASYRNQASMM